MWKGKWEVRGERSTYVNGRWKNNERKRKKRENPKSDRRRVLLNTLQLPPNPFRPPPHLLKPLHRLLRLPNLLLHLPNLLPPLLHRSRKAQVQLPSSSSQHPLGLSRYPLRVPRNVVLLLRGEGGAEVGSNLARDGGRELGNDVDSETDGDESDDGTCPFSSGGGFEEIGEVEDSFEEGSGGDGLGTDEGSDSEGGSGESDGGGESHGVVSFDSGLGCLGEEGGGVDESLVLVMDVEEIAEGDGDEIGSSSESESNVPNGDGSSRLSSRLESSEHDLGFEDLLGSFDVLWKVSISEFSDVLNSLDGELTSVVLGESDGRVEGSEESGLDVLSVLPKVEKSRVDGEGNLDSRSDLPSSDGLESLDQPHPGLLFRRRGRLVLDGLQSSFESLLTSLHLVEDGFGPAEFFESLLDVCFGRSNVGGSEDVEIGEEMMNEGLGWEEFGFGSFVEDEGSEGSLESIEGFDVGVVGGRGSETGGLEEGGRKEKRKKGGEEERERGGKGNEGQHSVSSRRWRPKMRLALANDVMDILTAMIP